MSRKQIIYWLLVTTIPLIGCSESLETDRNQENARQELAQKGIQYSEEDFIEQVQGGDSNAVDLFLIAGMSPNTKNEFGISALTIAAHRHPNIVKALLDKGADVNVRDSIGDTALIVAIRYGGNMESINLLLAKGADVNAKNRDGETALMFAADLPEVVNALLAKGVDVNAKDDRGWTALIRAVYGGHPDTVKALLARGADVNARANDGETALMWSAGRPEIAKVLLAKGADVNAKSDSGKTPLKVAERQGALAMVRLLKQAGAKE